MFTNNSIKLIKSLDKKKSREEFGLFVVESDKIVQEAIENVPELIQELYYTKDFALNLNTNEFSSEEISQKNMDRISFLKNPQHAIAVLKLPLIKNIDITKKMLILDTIQDPGNLGTMIRLCDWFGISQIVCSEDTADCFNPRVVQASMGSVFRVNVHYLELNTFIPTLKIPSYAATLEGRNAYAQNYNSQYALVIGNEGNGIRTDIKKLCTAEITIPKFGITESLNASSATAILLSEMSRNELIG